jgi:transcriptional regulator with XRE-family HTH domain
MKIDLKRFRKDKKLSQEAVGTMFGTGQTNISMIEKDDRSLTEEQFNILIERYGEDEISKYAIIENKLSIKEERNLIPFYDDVRTVGSTNTGADVSETHASTSSKRSARVSV